MAKIFKDVKTVLAAKIIGIFLGFFNSIFLVRLLGAEGNGIYAMIMATSELLVLVTTINFTLATIYFSSKKDANYGKIMGICYSLILLSLIISISIFLLLPLTNFSSTFIPTRHPVFYAIISLTIIFLLELRHTYSSILKGRKNFKDLFYSNTLYSGFRFFLFGALVLFQNQLSFLEIEEIIMLHVCTLFLHAICNYYFYRKEFKIKILFKLNPKTDVIPFLKYSSTSFIAILGSFLSSKINIWLIAFFLTSTDLGYFALAIYFFNLVMQLPLILRNVLMPYLVSGSPSEKQEYFMLFSRVNATVSILLVMPAILLMDWLVPLFYGEDFMSAVLAIKIMLIAACLHSVRAIFAVYFYANNKIKYNVISNYLALLLIIMGGIIFVPTYGITAAAFTSLVAYGLSMLVIGFIGIYVEKLPPANYFILTLHDIKTIRNNL